MLLPGENVQIVPDKLVRKLIREMYMLSVVSIVKLEQAYRPLCDGVLEKL